MPLPLPLRRVLVSGAAACVVSFAACTANNNILLGEVTTDLDGHPTRVTDCYRLSLPASERFETGDGPEVRWTPCRDAAIVIRANVLTVNGQSYGTLRIGQKILVDHGQVSLE